MKHKSKVASCIGHNLAQIDTVLELLCHGHIQINRTDCLHVVLGKNQRFTLLSCRTLLIKITGMGENYEEHVKSGGISSIGGTTEC